MSAGAGTNAVRPTAKPIPRGADRRFDYAVDRILNSATMAGHIDAFWRFVDGDSTAIEEFPS